MSGFLIKQKQALKDLVKRLSEDYKYVSILGTDTSGTRYQLSRTGSSINESSWVERGFVSRVYNGKSYSEYSFNEIDNMGDVEREIRQTIADNKTLIENHGFNSVAYPLLEDEELTESFLGEIESHPEQSSSEEIINSLRSEMNRGLKLADYLIDLRMIYEYAHVSKLFISSGKELEQSYVWSQGYSYPIGQNEKGMKYSYRSFSGMKGIELLEEMKAGVEPAVLEVEELLNAERLLPGEYEIICAVASAGVNMHDGAKAAFEVSSYLFDDEGTLGTDTQVIEKGILKSGISDLLSAAKLGTVPTGNGKRESFERKAYSRMTNTFFSPGKDKLEDMIASVKKGYLLENYTCGMEDPKNWGIQCVALKGKEILNGKLTGRTVAPVYLTGFVPDLLQSISMISGDLKLSGSGACGKGYKEFVKTSTGGPYLKTKGRLA